MKLVRKIALKILKATAFDTIIKHHFTNEKFLLNTYHHKGYWFYGSKREKNTIKVFQSWIKSGDYVLEIGGHIGFFSTFYACVVGGTGKVDVFEPSAENAKYLNRNIAFLPENQKRKVSVINKGAGDKNEKMEFYIDPISGQNNSFVKNFEGFLSNRELSAETKTELITENIDVITLDSYFEETTHFPDFVKIDVEGFEWNVIKGFAETITKSHPKLMIEIQTDAEEIINFFKEKRYSIYNDMLVEIKDYNEYLSKSTPNIFFRFN